MLVIRSAYQLADDNYDILGFNHGNAHRLSFGHCRSTHFVIVSHNFCIYTHSCNILKYWLAAYTKLFYGCMVCTHEITLKCLQNECIIDQFEYPINIIITCCYFYLKWFNYHVHLIVKIKISLYTRRLNLIRYYRSNVIFYHLIKVYNFSGFLLRWIIRFTTVPFIPCIGWSFQLYLILLNYIGYL